MTKERWRNPPNGEFENFKFSLLTFEQQLHDKFINLCATVTW